ncbi:MAG: PhzF family phenazine biosynthesis protein [Methylococcales bacterium]
MRLTIYQIDAFANRAFEGNPAAVIPLEAWLSDDVMQSIAEENNLAETAFFVAVEQGFEIRWFTPVTEVKLCGHATLASAYVIFNIIGYASDNIEFESPSGKLSVARNNEILTLNFPSYMPVKCEIPELLVKGLGLDKMAIQPQACMQSDDYIVVVENEEQVAAINPELHFLKQIDLRGVIVTSPSKSYDFVCRFFAPKYGIPEDPVTGSAFTQLIPYWSEQLGKTQLTAKQISSRGGEVLCELTGDRVLISGQAVKYLEGYIQI